MNDTIITCGTQIITTLITVGVTVLVAYLTYRSQKKKEADDIKRLQEVNRKSALELFKSYIANLFFFSSPKEVEMDRKILLVCIEKMKTVEQYLSELTESELPDTFIEKFIYYRVKLEFQRIDIEKCMVGITEDKISSAIFENLETMSLISEVSDFISLYDSTKTEG